MKRSPIENTPRVIALAVAFFGGLAALAHFNGVFERLGAELVVALALFAAAFGLLTGWLDPGVRALVRRAFGWRATLARPGAPSAPVKEVQA